MSIRINGDNTAANPGITGTDTDTGLQFGTDEVNIVTGGSIRTRVDSSGRVLIGQNDTTGIDAEADDLVVSSTAHTGITVRSGSSHNASVYFADQDAVRPGRIEYNHTSDFMRFNTSGTERFRFGADGELGIGGATFGTSGQVLTSQGSGSAPQWATLTDTNGYTWLTGTAMTGSGTITTTGIDTDATDVIILFEAVQMASTGWMQMRVGNGSEDTGNNYDWSCADPSTGWQQASANTIFRLQHTSNSSNLHTWSGHVRLMRNDADHFIMTSVMGSTFQAPSVAGGRWYGGTTGIDRVSISTGTGNFNGGRTTVGYIA